MSKVEDELKQLDKEVELVLSPPRINPVMLRPGVRNLIQRVQQRRASGSNKPTT